MLDLRRLSYFLAVATDGSFTRASRRLHVAQPALSRQVRLLEEELGCALLIRGGADGVRPTPAGAVLLGRAPGLICELEEAWAAAAAAGEADRAARVLHLGYAASAGYNTASRIIGALRDRDPLLSVDARVFTLPEAEAALAEGSLDAAIVRCPAQTPGYERLVLRHEAQGVLVRADDPLAAHEAISLAELADLPIVIHPRAANPGRYDLIVAACRAVGFDPEFHEPLIAFDPSHEQVAAGTHITFVSNPGSGLRAGLAWRPLTPALVLDVALVAPSGAGGALIPELFAAARDVISAHGWLEAA